VSVTEPRAQAPAESAGAGRDEQHEIDGMRVHVEWRGPRTGPVTVVLHGGGPGCHSAADFAGVLARLPERRWLLVDLPGYGSSGPPADLGPVFSAHARVLLGLLGLLGLDRVDVLAQSLGGSVALKLAADHPERVRRIVLVGSQPVPAPAGTTSDPGLGVRVRQQYYGGGRPTPAAMRRLMADLEWYDAAAVPDELVRARHAASVTPTAVAAATDAGRRGTPEDLTPDLAGVTAPTLVLWGRHDPFAGPDYALAVSSALPAADLVVLSASAHHPQAERPDAVAALVAGHLGDPAAVFPAPLEGVPSV
jgi:pimeloyl-ACP methyl ester carboxylesterase